MKLSPLLLKTLRRPCVAIIGLDILVFAVLMLSERVVLNILDSIMYNIIGLVAFNFIVGNVLMITSMFYTPAAKYGRASFLIFFILLLVWIGWIVYCMQVEQRSFT